MGPRRGQGCLGTKRGVRSIFIYLKKRYFIVVVAEARGVWPGCLRILYIMSADLFSIIGGFGFAAWLEFLWVVCVERIIACGGNKPSIITI